MKTVCIAGATGYLGRHLVREYLDRGWQVRALVRDRVKAAKSGLGGTLVEVQPTRAETLGVMAGADLVVSALGITRQRDGLSYRDVDYQANANLLDAACASGVGRFAYVHVLNAQTMRGVSLVEAKQAFVERLRQTDIAATVICPSGFFSDMEDFLNMARGGRVWIFGDGQRRLNPIHGADLASAAADAIEAGRVELPVGGPDVFTHEELARLAFDTLERPMRLTRLPDGLRRAVLAILPYVTPAHVSGPARFFLSAMGADMVGERHGKRHLADHFRQMVNGD
ncbi:SDR family oxidoreductase [Aliiruegeria haliotis]|uniref:SDR family oxidoreductase n=1 Tax=Aliiruegeria haliotis TaxID=1280846 RepID=UPI000D066809|nr:SDR family oxidoreductase [Aliiruegeria haliotis]